MCRSHQPKVPRFADERGGSASDTVSSDCAPLYNDWTKQWLLDKIVKRNIWHWADTNGKHRATLLSLFQEGLSGQWDASFFAGKAIKKDRSVLRACRPCDVVLAAHPPFCTTTAPQQQHQRK